MTKKKRFMGDCAVSLGNYLNRGIHMLFNSKHLTLLVIQSVTRSALFDAIALAEIDTDLLV